MKFEQTLMIEDRSTPKLVSIWDSLNSYKIYNSAMNKSDLNQYISKIMERKSWVKFSDKVGNVLFAEENKTSSELWNDLHRVQLIWKVIYFIYNISWISFQNTRQLVLSALEIKVEMQKYFITNNNIFFLFYVYLYLLIESLII